MAKARTADAQTRGSSSLNDNPDNSEMIRICLSRWKIQGIKMNYFDFSSMNIQINLPATVRTHERRYWRRRHRKSILLAPTARHLAAVRSRSAVFWSKIITPSERLLRIHCRKKRHSAPTNSCQSNAQLCPCIVRFAA